MSDALRGTRNAGSVLIATLLGVQALRLLVAFVGGIANASDHEPFAPDRFHTGYVLVSFGSAGDGVGVLLLALATGLLWAGPSFLTTPLQSAQRWRQRDLAVVLLGLTALSAAVHFAGLLVQASVPRDSWRQVIVPAGFELVYAVASLGALVAVRRLDAADVEGAEAGTDGDETGAAVFAVDRKTGAVLAWTSLQDARANAPLYSVEDDEYDWFLDDGVVLEATAVNREVHLQPTPAERPEELLGHLTAYAERRGLAIDEPDEPLAYVDPISRDHYLEMWPGWLRWIGRLAR